MKNGSIIFFITCFVIFLSFELEAQWIEKNGPCSGQITAISGKGNVIVSAAGNGIFRSFDSGLNWEFGSDAGEIFCLTMNNEILLAGTYNGIILSTDLGTTWKSSSLTGVAVYDIIVDDSCLFAGTSNGVFSSSDNGGTWGSTGLHDPEGKYVYALAISNGNLIAGTYIGIYCSTDKGKNWKFTWSDYNMLGSQDRFAVLGKTVLSNHLRSTDGGETWTELGVNAFNIAADETNVLATIPFSSGKYSVSQDSGKTWSSSSAGIEHITAVSILKSLEKNIFMGSYGSGIFKWSDSMKSWSSITGTLTHPEILASNDSFLVAGSIGRGIFLSTNNGGDWKTFLGDTNMVDIRALAVNEGNIYAGIKYGGVYLSSDRGANWTFFGLPGKLVQSLKIQGEYIFAGTWGSGIYRTSKNEANWTPVWSAGLYVNDFAFKDNHYFAAMDEGVFVSIDSGVNWIRILNSKAKALAFAGERLFAASDNDGIYVSTDLGATWNQTGLTGMGITKLASDGQQIFAGSSSYKGVFWFSDFRQSWRNVGLPEEKIEALVVKGRVLYSAAWIDGVWSTPISEITEVKQSIDSSIPVDFCLFNNYPNPFNPSTTISFKIPWSQMVELKVYDMLGREVAELINEYRQAGSYSTQFNGSHLSSGIYFYKLKAGNFIQTKKLILLK